MVPTINSMCLAAGPGLGGVSPTLRGMPRPIIMARETTHCVGLTWIMFPFKEGDEVVDNWTAEPHAPQR